MAEELNQIGLRLARIEEQLRALRLTQIEMRARQVELRQTQIEHNKTFHTVVATMDRIERRLPADNDG